MTFPETPDNNAPGGYIDENFFHLFKKIICGKEKNPFYF